MRSGGGEVAIMNEPDDLIRDAMRQFYAHTEDAILYNLRLGYRGDVYAWMEVIDGKITCHVTRQPPLDESGLRFKTHVLKYDLSDEKAAEEALRKVKFLK